MLNMWSFVLINKQTTHTCIELGYKEGSYVYGGTSLRYGPRTAAR